MFKRFLRWTIPFIVLMLVAMYLAFSPVLASHAASPAINNQDPVPMIQLHSHHDTSPKNSTPYMRWRP